MNRENYRNGIEALLQLQTKLGHRPKRHHIPKMVDKIIKENHLKHDPREHYFRVLCYSALLGKEAMYNKFKPIKKKRRQTIANDEG